MLSSEPANPDKPELKPQENEAEKLSEPAQQFLSTAAESTLEKPKEKSELSEPLTPSLEEAHQPLMKPQESVLEKM